MNKLKNWLVLSLAAVLIAACAAATPTPSEPPAAEPTEEATAPEGARDTIVIGDIGSDPAEIIEGAQPLADYLAANLGEFGVTSGEVRVADSDTELIQMIQDGEVDLYFDSAYPATLIIEATGAEPLVRRWRSGVGEYHTVIFASKASGVTSLEQLNGKTIALDNEFSTSGYLVPVAYLIEQGMTLVEKSAPSSPVKSDEVGYAFSDADDNTVQWVVSGETAAGAIDNVRYSRLDPEVTDQFIVLAETDPVPRQIGLVRSDLDPALKATILDLLLKAEQSDEGKAALEAFSNTTRFDEFPEGIEKALDHMRELIEIIEAANNP